MKKYKRGIHLINNNYQEDSFFRIKETAFPEAEINKIVIEHNADPKVIGEVKLWVRSPFSRKTWRLVLPVLGAKKKILRYLKNQTWDPEVLIIHSEYDPLTHLFVEHFSKNSLDVVLIEDGRLATYVDNFKSSSDRLTKKDILIYKVFWRGVLGLKSIVPYRIGTKFFARTEDKNITSIAVSRVFQSGRKIPVDILDAVSMAKKSKRKTSGDSAFVFYGQPMYREKSKAEMYWDLVEKIYAMTVNQFRLKFRYSPHPRESNQVVKKFLEKRSIFSQPIEKNESLSLAGAFSIYSSVLLEIQEEQGAPVFFLNRIFSPSNDSAAEAIDNFLMAQGYDLPRDLSELSKIVEDAIYK